MAILFRLLAGFSLLALVACGQPSATGQKTAAPSGSQAASASASRSGGSPATSGKAPTTPAALAAYQGSDRQQILEASAKKEGTLTWYTTLAGPILDSLVGGFKSKYPFLNVDVYRSSESDIITRAMQEGQANKPVFDVAELQPTAIEVLAEGKLLMPFYSPSVARLPEALKIAAGNSLATAAADRISYISFGYNTTLVPKTAVPKAMDDLMNPAFAGKLTLARNTTGYRWAGAVLHLMGEERGRKWLADFGVRQKPSVQQISGKAILDLVAKGELPASPDVFLDHVQQAKAAKAPVEWVVLDPVVGNVGDLALDAKAPHINAALLYIDYLLGEDGQQVLKRERYFPATEKVPFNFWIPEQGKTAAQVEKEDKDWSDLFNADFR